MYDIFHDLILSTIQEINNITIADSNCNIDNYCFQRMVSEVMESWKSTFLFEH